MSQVESRVIEFAGRTLSGLEKAGPVTAWALENKTALEAHLGGYDELVDLINSISPEDPILGIMPKVQVLKRALVGRDLPKLDEMAPGNFVRGVREAKDPMLHGQKLKKKQIEAETPEDKAYAIGTPSMETTPEALAVGTAGHLAERTFFQWARSKNLAPKSGWHKDDWLQALDEAALLMLEEDHIPKLAPFFLNSNQEGGLGWLNKEKADLFHSKCLGQFKTG